MIDLHSHSTASDGSMSPHELVQHALRQGLTALSLTDHDTVSGIDEAIASARGTGLNLIPGIEIEAAWEDRGVFHVLGLGVDHTSVVMQALIPIIQGLRNSRNKLILERMAAAGIHATMDNIAGKLDSTIITRPHFADYLISIGLVKDRQQAFDQYLTPGKPFFEPYPGLPLETIVQTIHNAKGKSVVAHPLSLYVSWGRMEKLMHEWKAIGVDGIETWHPSASWNDAKRLDKLAMAAGLRISAGSDFHGTARPDRILGKTLEERHTIDDRFMALFDE